MSYLVLGIALFLCNVWTPPIADDYFFGLRLATVNGTPDIVMEKATESSHLWESLSLQWSLDNFRLGNILARVFLFIEQGKGWLFALANTAIFLLMIGSLAQLVFKKQTALSLLVTTAFFFIFCPGFGPTGLWLAGSLNYLWGGCMLSGFLLSFQQIENNQAHRKWHIAVCILTSFLATWFHEALAAPLIGALLCYFVITKCTKRHILLYIPLSLIIFLFVLTAGGMSERVSPSPLLEAVVKSLQASVTTIAPHIVIVGILAFVFRERLDQCWRHLIFWVTLFELLLYLYSGGKGSWGPEGPAYFPLLSLMICSLYLLRKSIEQFSRIVITCSGLITCSCVVTSLCNTNSWHRFHEEVLQAIQRGERTIAVDYITPDSETPWMLRRSLPCEYYAIVYPYFPYYYQCPPTMVVINRLVENKGIYAEMPEAQENVLQTMRYGDFMIFQLPKPWFYGGNQSKLISEATTRDKGKCYWYGQQCPSWLYKLKFRLTKKGELYSWGLDYHDGHHYVLLEMPESAQCETMHLRILNSDNMEERLLAVPVTSPVRININDPRYIEEITPNSKHYAWMDGIRPEQKN